MPKKTKNYGRFQAESQESGTGSVEEEIDESPQSLSIEKGKRQRKSRDDVAADCLNKLELLKKFDTTGWSERKLRIRQIAIEKLAFRVESEKTVATKSRKFNEKEKVLPFPFEEHFDKN